jgi:hypothetical protein
MIMSGFVPDNLGQPPSEVAVGARHAQQGVHYPPRVYTRVAITRLCDV